MMSSKHFARPSRTTNAMRPPKKCVGPEHIGPGAPSWVFRPYFGVRAANFGMRALDLPRPGRMLCIPHRKRNQNVTCGPASGFDWRNKSGVAKAVGGRAFQQALYRATTGGAT